MSDNAFQNLSILSSDPWGGKETKSIAVGATEYLGPYFITNQDSIHGIFATFIGTRYGVNNVTITLQDATTAAAPDAAWTDVDAGANFGSGGTVGVPVSVHLIAPFAPASGTIKPYVRFKIVAGAATGATFTQILRTIRGLK